MVSVEEALEFFEIHIKCIREEWNFKGEYRLGNDRWIDKQVLEDLEEGLIVLKEAFNVYI